MLACGHGVGPEAGTQGAGRRGKPPTPDANGVLTGCPVSARGLLFGGAETGRWGRMAGTVICGTWCLPSSRRAAVKARRIAGKSVAVVASCMDGSCRMLARFAGSPAGCHQGKRPDGLRSRKAAGQAGKWSSAWLGLRLFRAGS